MDTKLGSLKVPPASLPIFPVSVYVCFGWFAGHDSNVAGLVVGEGVVETVCFGY
jgi:hypothetical protein